MKPKYEVKLNSMELKYGVSLPTKTSERMKGYQTVWLFYDSRDVVKYQQIPILSFWGFVSSVGGSLGLFLGFSFYSIIFPLIDNIKKIKD